MPKGLSLTVYLIADGHETHNQSARTSSSPFRPFHHASDHSRKCIFVLMSRIMRVQ